MNDNPIFYINSPFYLDNLTGEIIAILFKSS